MTLPSTGKVAFLTALLGLVKRALRQVSTVQSQSWFKKMGISWLCVCGLFVHWYCVYICDSYLSAVLCPFVVACRVYPLQSTKRLHPKLRPTNHRSRFRRSKLLVGQSMVVASHIGDLQHLSMTNLSAL